jgi:hypothetical protein
MQRLSIAVLVSVATLAPAHASAQTTGKPAAAPTPAADATAVKPPAVKPAAPPDTARRPDERLSDEAELSRIVGLYEVGKYRECSTEIESLLDPTGRAPLRQPSIVENARLYWAACLIGGGESEAADSPLRAAIHENPQMKPPDSLVFPQPVVQRFLKVRDSLVNEIRAAEEARIKQAQAEARQREESRARDRARLEELEALARQELVVVQNRRVLAFVPFGVGQIQNRQEVLGYTLMASQTLLLGLGTTAITVQSRLAAEAERQAAAGRVVKNADLLSSWGLVKRISFWGFAALAVGGVVEAQVAYVPEFYEVRPRRKRAPTPSGGGRVGDVLLVPYAEAGGGGLGLTGRF